MIAVDGLSCLGLTMLAVIGLVCVALLTPRQPPS